MPYGHLKRRDGEVAAEMILHRPADHAPREQVDDDRKVQPALPRSDVGDIGGPDLIRSARRELTLHQISRYRARVR